MIYATLKDILLFLFKICLSIEIGYCLGKERRGKGSKKGSRTFAIVSLSACLISIMSLEMHNIYDFDFMRIMSYGIASIGFLGSGLIIKEKGGIKGITTASTLFCLLPINYLIGLGYYLHGIISAILVYLILKSKYWRWSNNE